MGHRSGLFAAVAVAAACASPRSPAAGPQGVPVITDPPGATATADSQSITTPGTLFVPERAREMEIRIEKTGFEEQIVLLLPREQSSRSYKDCIDRATLSPGDATPNDARSSGAFVIGSAAARALAGCSDSAVPLLEPGMVFVKLAPLPELPVPRRALASLQ